MKQFLETLKSARWIEVLLLSVFLCVLLIIMLEGRTASSDSDEVRMARILSAIAGAGEVTVMLGGEDQGALVLAEGAGDISVMLSLQRAVQTLTGLPIEKIEIVQSN